MHEPHRGDQWQLANRLFVDEALGLRRVVEERVRLVGARLLCPLLEEAAQALTGVPASVVEAAIQHRPMLRYVAQQMSQLSGAAVMAQRELRTAFSAQWQQARGLALSALSSQMALQPLDVMGLPDMVAMSPPGAMSDNVLDQASLLAGEEVGWLVKRHSTVAYIELRRAGAISSANDFVEVIASTCSLSETFASHFWCVSLSLLLWGRALRLRAALEGELQRRLPPEARLDGPWVLPRQKVLRLAQQAAAGHAASLLAASAPGSAWRAGNGCTAGPIPCTPAHAGLLWAQVICQDERALAVALATLCQDPAYPQPQAGGTADAGWVSLDLVRVVSDFHGDRRQLVFQRAAGVLLVLSAVNHPGGRAEPIRQLVEVEVMVSTAKEGRWLSHFLELSPADAHSPQEASRSLSRSASGPPRRRPLY